jgi:hypothetical protein
MIIIKDSIYKQIVEKFLHHMASKFNVTSLMMELNYSKDDLVKSIKEMENIFILYRGMLMQKNEAYINNDKIFDAFSYKECRLLVNNFTDYRQYKAIILYLLYELSNENTTITINSNNLIYENTDMLKVMEVEFFILKEWRDMFTSPMEFLYTYKKTDNNLTFIF